MFTEVLRIKPVLDQGTALSMERNLSSRFTRAASVFGRGLKNILRGSIFGVSLALINKILNPLKEIEDKIKALTGESTDLTDLADRLGTRSGTLANLNSIAIAGGAKPEELLEAIKTFADKFETAKFEFSNPDKTVFPSETSYLLKDLVEKNNPDILQNFLEYVGGLQAVSERQNIRGQKEVFGSVATGGLGRFFKLNNLGAVADAMALPNSAKLSEEIDRVSGITALQRSKDEGDKARDFLRKLGLIGTGTLNAVSASDSQERQDDFESMSGYLSNKPGSDAFKNIGKSLENIGTLLGRLVGLLEPITKNLPAITNPNRDWRKTIKDALHPWLGDPPQGERIR